MAEFSYDSELVATACEGQIIKLYKTDNEQCLATFELNKGGSDNSENADWQSEHLTEFKK